MKIHLNKKRLSDARNDKKINKKRPWEKEKSSGFFFQAILVFSIIGGGSRRHYSLSFQGVVCQLICAEELTGDNWPAGASCFLCSLKRRPDGCGRRRRMWSACAAATRGRPSFNKLTCHRLRNVAETCFFVAPNSRKTCRLKISPLCIYKKWLVTSLPVKAEITSSPFIFVAEAFSYCKLSWAPRPLVSSSILSTKAQPSPFFLLPGKAEVTFSFNCWFIRIAFI